VQPAESRSPGVDRPDEDSRLAILLPRRLPARFHLNPEPVRGMALAPTVHEEFERWK